MATVTEGKRPGELGFPDRLRHLAEQANPAFAVGSFLVPLAFVVASVALNSQALLFYTHVAAGSVWFAVAIVFPAVIGPVIGGLDTESAADVLERFTPKASFFIFGFSFTTVVSGTILLTGRGLSYGFTGFWPTAALGLGWGLFLFGLLVPNRLHLKNYYEHRSSNPDDEVLESLEKRIIGVELFEAVMMLAIIATMAGLRLNIQF